MKSYSLLVILAMCKMIETNESVVLYDNSGIPAMLFVEKESNFFIIPNKNYDLKMIHKRDEALFFICPASQDEIKQLKTSASNTSKNNGELPTTATSSPPSGDLSKLRIPPSSKSEAKSSTSPSVKEAQLRSRSSTSSKSSRSMTSLLSTILPISKKEPESPDSSSSSSNEEDLRIPIEPNNDEEKNNKDYHNDHFTDLTKILKTLASPAGPIVTQYSAPTYCCEKNYKPQKALVKNHCGRLAANDVDEPGELFGISYKFKFPEDGKKLRNNELFVYAKCFSKYIGESLYVIYKIIPSISIEEPEPINYDNFDPTSVYHIDVFRPYYMSIQKDLLKELDKEIADDVIPQRLIPAYSIAEDYSRGTLVNDHDIFRPQWRSKAKIWDDLSRVIFNHGKKLQWIIYTGTVGTLLTKNNKPLVVRKKGLLPLTIPLFWWTLIMKTNSEKGEGIVIGMLNLPSTNNIRALKNYKKLCNTEKTCADLGWGEIINRDNSNFIVCCEVIGDTTSPLIGHRMELYVLSLEVEKLQEREQDRVRVNTLARELRLIGNIYLKWRTDLEEQNKLPQSPDSEVPSSPNPDGEVSPGTESLNPESPNLAIPSSPVSSGTESPKLSPPSSPEHQFDGPSPTSILSTPNPAIPSSPVSSGTESPKLSPSSSSEHQLDAPSPTSILSPVQSPSSPDETDIPESQTKRSKHFSFTNVRKKLPTVNVRGMLSKVRSPL